ncbi:putative Polysaccharide deacetylase [Taphrina deformans PYCC 5710]|uniref:chitin deacetylase n=1 Tax=Taphrina deformans (strain PYCC 5710 / ATCC 11124 / CBS 356.35 / IMI 108563 / JCM 9778 / NBRC 8474) TaxID=1097556 RepID=R4XDM1_TAPDE|nr:putative Polysaccharide deacetylase [Taphrina deformans PYCC 5710]|eukprot:CCG82503.1 putative Polysaccharide deacetylase [Taphrina deformans PYCC 5710]
MVLIAKWVYVVVTTQDEDERASENISMISAFRVPFFRYRHSRRRRVRIYIMFLLILIGLALLVPAYLIYKPPHLLITALQYKWPEVLFYVPTQEKIIALTIDDSPSQFTPEILSILTENNATATFFVIGKQAQSEDSRSTLKKIVSQGSELGNHAMFDEPSRALTAKEFSEQVAEVDVFIEETYAAAGKTRDWKFFRPGSGFFSKVMITSLQSLGYSLVLGNIYPHDPQIPYAWVNARHILSMARPGGIIICHDRRSWTLPMLRRVLPELKRRGYKVMSVSELVTYGK